MNECLKDCKMDSIIKIPYYVLAPKDTDLRQRIYESGTLIWSRIDILYRSPFAYSYQARGQSRNLWLSSNPSDLQWARYPTDIALWLRITTVCESWSNYL